MKDEEILDLYWDRNENAITATAEKYGRYCHSISYNILHSHEDAEECVNDTYLGAWKSIPPRRPQLLSAYLGKITRNLSLNRFKQYTTQKRGQGQIPLLLSELTDCIPAETGPEQHTDEMFLAESISAFLYEQPRLKRDLFIRRYWYAESIGNLAKTYGISESKTASLLFRVRKQLKSHLEKEGITL